jgi:hypothetical protein
LIRITTVRTVSRRIKKIYYLRNLNRRYRSETYVNMIVSDLEKIRRTYITDTRT